MQFKYNLVPKYKQNNIILCDSSYFYFYPGENMSPLVSHSFYLLFLNLNSIPNN